MQDFFNQQYCHAKFTYSKWTEFWKHLTGVVPEWHLEWFKYSSTNFSVVTPELHPGKLTWNQKNGGLEDDVPFQLGVF